MSAGIRHYTVERLESVDQLREMFPLGEADDLNWVFVGTSGVHGSSTTLDELERRFRDGDPDDEGMFATVLVAMPRMVHQLYGEIEIDAGDIPFLRSLVRSTLIAVARTQADNL